ncbi:hypothetical protein K449DRAFT_420569 [Hypoxylon sp. EC38]|nr:hypothetical protein K449DRAFT_420569 [Hypoxylon sp. EC38]
MSGYAAIAKRMSSGSDLTSFRNFSTLNYQNILYLQAELTHLESSWREKEKEIQKEADIDNKNRSPYDWAQLQKNGEAWDNFLRLREKLKEYNETLIQQHIISHFEKPSKRSLKALNHILDDASKSEYLLGKDSTTWSNAETVRDLVTVGPVEKLDRISIILTRLYLTMVYKVFGKFSQKKDDIIHLEDSALLFPTRVLSVALSSLLPVAAISVLYVVHSMWRRLLILAAFTSAFSVILSLITAKSGRLELFAATAT